MERRILSVFPCLLAAWIGLAIGGSAPAAQRSRPPAPPATWHDEALRPQFHFTADQGWINDPNGLVFYNGEYHLFFQHNPHGTNWINDLNWGHAVSPDLLHWKYLPEAIGPTALPGGKFSGAWSGTGFVDWKNTGGFAAEPQPPIVLAWTGTSRGQCLAFSNDAGRTFTQYPGNPVLPMGKVKGGDWNRDPDVFWYAPAKHWVMIISISGRGFAFHTSADLRHWTRQSLLPGFFECPNCFELPVDGDPGNPKWVIWDASGKYAIGRFDGKTFTPESGPFRLDRGPNDYAAQTWSDAPAARRIGIAWMRGGRFPGMPFNQQMSIPFELRLRTIPSKGLRLTKYPVREVKGLRYDPKTWKDLRLKAGEDPLAVIEGDTFDIEATIRPGDAKAYGFVVRGQKITLSNGAIACLGASAPLEHQPRSLEVRILVDRTSIEVFVNRGETALTCAFLPRADDRRLALFSQGGTATLSRLTIWRMRSVWH